ncbi:MAG: HNH endonuclease, partial [Oscillospiraceae bacterium]|nr:HNH endonuclease [Oscillospiraceae bacterium]
MKDYAKAFYSSKAWKVRRAEYRREAGGLCERCRSKGLITPGEIVHHRVPISPLNIDDVEITLGGSNLELLCRECHAAMHETPNKRRFRVDAFGRVTAKDAPPVAEMRRHRGH